MKVSEIFRSVQGEGKNVGKPAIFLRMALCNLTCEWCDTKYTWDWKNYEYEQEVKEMSAIQIEEQVLKHDTKHLVLTGGEPMLQQKALIPLFTSLKQKGFFFEVETNGTVTPMDEMLDLIDRWNVSPKLENSKNSQSLREKPDCYQFFNNLPNSCFKYVIQNLEDLGEVQLLSEKYRIPGNKIILMPEAQSQEQLAARSAWLAALCKELGYLFSTRLHIELWGNKRGV